MSFKVMSVLGASSVASIYGYANTYPESFSKLTKTIQDTVGQIIRSENINRKAECTSISPVRKDLLNKKVTLLCIGNGIGSAWTGEMRSNGFYEGSYFFLKGDRVTEFYYSNGSMRNNFRVHDLNQGVFRDLILTDDVKNITEKICNKFFASGLLNKFNQTEQFLEPSEAILECSKINDFIQVEERKRIILESIALVIIFLGTFFAANRYINRNQ